MHRISALVILVAAATFANGQSAPAADESCGSQHADMFMCVMDAKNSDEVKVIMEKKKSIMNTCAPDFPKSCFAKLEAMNSCVTDFYMKSKTETAKPEFYTIKNATLASIDKCFESEPSDPLAGLEELIMPPMMKMPKGGHAHEKMGAKSDAKSAETGSTASPAQPSSHAASAESKEDFEIPKECMKKPEQLVCIRKQLQDAAASDTLFALALDSLMEKKQNCDKSIKRQCALSTPELKKCFMEAHVGLFKFVMTEMKTCMDAKMANGTATIAVVPPVNSTTL